MKKPLNHLASKTEQLTNYRLPHQQKLLQLHQLTLMVHEAWQDLLPEELLATLSVIFCDQTNLTVNTNNQTLANHLNYNRHLLLKQLVQLHPSLHPLTNLRFRAIVLEKFQDTSNQLQCNQHVSNVNSRELSESTKQNIAHLAELVTDDIKLQRALHKLIKS